MHIYKIQYIRISLLLKTAFIIATILCCFVNAQDSLTKDTAYVPSKKIIKIYFNGNRVSHENILKMYLGIDTGMIYDSALVASGKHRLMSTNLFSKVDVLPLQKYNGIVLYVVVSELFYLLPDGGGDYVDRKYGENVLWYNLGLGLTIKNFGGDFETVAIRASGWENRSVGISWNKPIFPSPYIIAFSANVREYPDFNFPWQRFYANGRIAVGRRILGKSILDNDKSNISVSLAPTFSTITDTGSSTPFASNKELYAMAGIYIDDKATEFDTKKGWSLFVNLLSNAMYAGIYNRYGQLNMEVCSFQPGFLDQNVFACKAQLVCRTNDGGPYKALYIGGNGSVRGFTSDEIGLSNIMNDYVLFSGEYRFPMWTMPAFDAWVLSAYSDQFRNVTMRFDGALIADAGHIWHDVQYPFINRENAVGIGAGLRVMLPALQRSGCIDFVWGGYQDHTSSPKFHFFSSPLMHQVFPGLFGLTPSTR